MSVATKAPDPQKSVPSHMPSLMFTNEKDGAPQHKPLASLPHYRYWAPNVHQTTWVLVVDMDSSRSAQDLVGVLTAHPELPAPSWYIEKAENGHGQLGYVIQHVSYGPNSRIAPQNYARAVLHALRTIFDGDPHFTNSRSWNPWWSGWKKAGLVSWGDMKPRSLRELHAAIEAAGLWESSTKGSGLKTFRTRKSMPGTGTVNRGSRNTYVFDATRLRMSGPVDEVAHALNHALSDPMDAAEVNGIVRSIKRYENKTGRRGGQPMSQEQIEQQRERGAKGGSRKTEAQTQALARGRQIANTNRQTDSLTRAESIRLLHERGRTQKQIMSALKVSRSTVARALKDPSD